MKPHGHLILFDITQFGRRRIWVSAGLTVYIDGISIERNVKISIQIHDAVFLDFNGWVNVHVCVCLYLCIDQCILGHFSLCSMFFLFLFFFVLLRILVQLKLGITYQNNSNNFLNKFFFALQHKTESVTHNYCFVFSLL